MAKKRKKMTHEEWRALDARLEAREKQLREHAERIRLELEQRRKSA